MLKLHPLTSNFNDIICTWGLVAHILMLLGGPCNGSYDHTPKSGGSCLCMHVYRNITYDLCSVDLCGISNVRGNSHYSCVL